MYAIKDHIPIYKTITETGFDYESFGDFHTEHDERCNKTTDKTTLPFSMFEDTMKDLSHIYYLNCM